MQRNWAAIVALAVLASGPQAAGAQAPHAIPPLVRALHERTQIAEVVALVRVTGIAAGRIAVETRAGLRGAPPASFEVKYSPLSPPQLRAGDRALLLLRGARSPYVLVDEPREVLVFDTDSDEAALRDGLPALLAVDRDLRTAACVYSSWHTKAPLLARLGVHGIAGIEQTHPEIEPAPPNGPGSCPAPG